MGKDFGKGKGDWGKGTKGKGKWGSSIFAVEDLGSSSSDHWGGEPIGGWQEQEQWGAASSGSQVWEKGPQQQGDVSSLEGNSWFDLGSIEIGAVEDQPSYRTSWGGEEWIKMNYDSGAQTSALPVEMAEGMRLDKKGDFLVANGDEVPFFNRIQLHTVDESGNPRKIAGTVSEVHKPLASGGELARNHDSFLWADGGALIPRWSPVAQEVRQAFLASCQKHGTEDLVKLYKEGNLYNFYLKRSGAPSQLNPVESQGSQGSSGGRRQP